ncbi:hypothetical protein [Acinetobacter sp. ANC 4648]|uniref:hypothetical protein n=1 Tax=Acinetobacter sp. ANC 4648 TaxID=1977875 RepID=UPI000A34D82D|nr:hypothetical protein [Acinetobacter sp. ANC 4648]OTG83693.1 hypothetical protein B9T27_04060 [Acinetobacter sp. ANC 4648]
MAKRKKQTSFYPWIDAADHSKGYKMNFSTVVYTEVARTAEGFMQVEFVELKNPELALDFAYPQSFYLSSEGLILHKLANGKFEVIAKTDNC